MTLHELETLGLSIFNQLPVGIQDPVDRGREPKAWWSAIPNHPQVHDLMTLSEEEFAQYRLLTAVGTEAMKRRHPKLQEAQYVQFAWAGLQQAAQLQRRMRFFRRKAITPFVFASELE